VNFSNCKKIVSFYFLKYAESTISSIILSMGEGMGRGPISK